MRPGLISTAVILMALSSSPSPAQTAPNMKVFGGAKIDEIYRVVLDRGALLLESINAVIKEKGIQEGLVQVTAGSLEECTFHYVASAAVKPKDLFKTVKGPYEILNAGGIIASGQPHIHMAIASGGKAAVGGHLENGCKVLYLAEVTIFKYAATPLLRQPNANGVMILDSK